MENKKQQHLDYLIGLLERYGWSAELNWYRFADRISVGTCLGTISLDKGESNIEIQLIAEQLELSTSADPNDLGQLVVSSSKSRISIERDFSLWKIQAKCIVNEVNLSYNSQ